MIGAGSDWIGGVLGSTNIRFMSLVAVGQNLVQKARVLVLSYGMY